VFLGSIPTPVMLGRNDTPFVFSSYAMDLADVKKLRTRQCPVWASSLSLVNKHTKYVAAYAAGAHRCEQSPI
jgi:hypothetical protein